MKITGATRLRPAPVRAPSTANLRRALRIALTSTAVLGGALGVHAFTPATSHAQRTDVNAEARVFFERGTRILERAARTRLSRRTELLEEALQAFVQSLRIVRSRNALYNAAAVLEELGRPNEAYAYYREFRTIPGLSEDESREAEARLEALRPRVALHRVESEPPGAEVFVDRLDLAPRGATPLDIALPPGEHTFYLRLPHHTDAELTARAAVGERTVSRATLEPVPVELELVVEGQREDEGARLLLDGEAVEAGPHRVAPGAHVARLEIEGRPPVEERITLAPGEDARLRLVAPQVRGGRLVIEADAPARFFVDGAEVGEGRRAEAALPSGAHQLRVEPQDSAQPPLEQIVSVRDGQESRVAVALGQAPRRRFGAAPYATLAATGVLGVLTLGLGVRALRVTDDAEQTCEQAPYRCEEARTRSERGNRMADGFLGATLALGASTLVLLLLNRRSGEHASEAQVQVGMTRHQLSVGARGQF